MKPLLFLCICASIALSACDGWPVNLTPYNPPTPAPSRTPSIRTATPIILSPVPSTPASDTLTPTDSFTATEPSSTTTETETPLAATLTPTGPVSSESLKVDILGCDTSIDILHGMGEVTNAYVKISNTGASDVENVCATLRGLDEGRPHPDKTKCLPSIPAGFQVTLKLTVDTTYKQDTPIQVEVTSGDTLLVRAGEPACKAIGLLRPEVTELGVLTPVP